MTFQNLTIEPSKTATPQAQRPTRAQTPLLLWLSGPATAEKTAIAQAVEGHLAALNRAVSLLDEGRDLEIGKPRRVGEVAKLLHESGLDVIVALAAPLGGERAALSALFPVGSFVEVGIDAAPGADRLQALALRTDQISVAEAAILIVQSVIGREWRPA